MSLVPTAVATATGEDLVRALTSTRGPLARPVVAVLPAQAARVELLPIADRGTLPAYSDAEDAARALAHAATRADWLARRPGAVPKLPDVETARAKDLATAYLEAHPEGGWLDPQTTAVLLGCYGVRQIPWGWARDENEAVAAAEQLAGPDGRVVMKAYWPGLVHKSEQHALHLDLQNASQVRAAHRDLVTRFGDRVTGVVVQPLAERGTELFAGVVQDEVFGPLVVFGLGGTATELLADHAARLAPLTDLDVHDLLTSPRCSPLLFGYAGSPAVDLAALPWSNSCTAAPGWLRTFPSWWRPTSILCWPGHAASPPSTRAYGWSRAGPTTRTCADCADLVTAVEREDCHEPTEIGDAVSDDVVTVQYGRPVLDGPGRTIRI